MSADTMRYNRVAMTLHWLIAALILLDFALALSFGRFNPGSPFYFSFAYDQHMSVGMLVLVLSIVRLLWRLMHRFPPLPPDMNLVSRFTAKASHTLLYAFMIVVPLSGWLVLSARKKPPVFFGSLHWPNFANVADLTHDQRTLIHKAMLPSHIAMSYVGMSLVGLHILAALYHHYARRDDVMLRMLPTVRLRGTSEGLP